MTFSLKSLGESYISVACPSVNPDAGTVLKRFEPLPVSA
jgi:hypothetical protein